MPKQRSYRKKQVEENPDEELQETASGETVEDSTRLDDFFKRKRANLNFKVLSNLNKIIYFL